MRVVAATGDFHSMQQHNAKAHPTERRMAVAYELPIIHQGENLLISAHLLHKKLKVQTRFGDWIKRRIQEYGFQNEQDYYSNMSKSSTKPFTDYLLTLDTAKEMAMVERNETGRQIRRYFIQKEKELRGILHLPKEAGMFKGITGQTVNGRKMYAFRQFLNSVGYNKKSSGYSYRIGYPGHFITMGHLTLITEELCLQIFASRKLKAARAANKAMQPVLPFGFGTPLQVGGTHA
jgi:phage anti-repressor protein